MKTQLICYPYFYRTTIPSEEPFSNGIASSNISTHFYLFQYVSDYQLIRFQLKSLSPFPKKNIPAHRFQVNSYLAPIQSQVALGANP